MFCQKEGREVSFLISVRAVSFLFLTCICPDTGTGSMQFEFRLRSSWFSPSVLCAGLLSPGAPVPQGSRHPGLGVGPTCAAGARVGQWGARGASPPPHWSPTVHKWAGPCGELKNVQFSSEDCFPRLHTRKAGSHGDLPERCCNVVLTDFLIFESSSIYQRKGRAQAHFNLPRYPNKMWPLPLGIESPGRALCLSSWWGGFRRHGLGNKWVFIIFGAANLWNTSCSENPTVKVKRCFF